MKEQKQEVKKTYRLKVERNQELKEIHQHLQKKFNRGNFSENEAINYLIETSHQRLKRFICKK